MREKMRQSDLFRMSWPVLAELIFIGIIGNFNQLIINAFSPDAVAATGSASLVFQLVVNVYGIISIGGSILLAPVIGAKKKEDGIQMALTILIDTMLMGFVLGLGCLLALPLILRMLHIPAELTSMTKEYLAIVLGLSVFQGMLSSLTAVYRSMGRMKLVMVNDALVNLSCVILNGCVLSFIPVHRQSISFYALNGILAQGLGVLVLLAAMKKDGFFSLKLNFRKVREILRRQSGRILHFGILGGLEGIVYLIGQTVVMGFVGMLGTQAMTARAYAANLTAYMAVFTSALSTACAPLVGMYLGEGRIRDVERICRKVIRLGIALTAVVSAVLMAVSGPVLRIYTKDAVMLEEAYKVLVVNIILELLRAIAGPAVAALKAVGDVVYPFKMVIVGMALNIGLSYICGVVLGWGLTGIWTGYITDMLFRSVMCWMRFKKGKWHNIRMF